MGFFPDDCAAPNWRSRGSNVSPAQLFKEDFFALLPEIYGHFDRHGEIRLDNIELYYVLSISKGLNSLVPNFLKIIRHRLARNEPLGKATTEYLGQKFDEQIETNHRPSGTRKITIGRGTQGKGKNAEKLKKKLVLALHLQLLGESDSRHVTDNEKYIRAAELLVSEAGQLNVGNLPQAKLIAWIDECDWLSDQSNFDEISELNQYAKFAAQLWSLGAGGSASILPQLVMHYSELDVVTPEAVLISYLSTVLGNLDDATAQ